MFGRRLLILGGLLAASAASSMATTYLAENFDSLAQQIYVYNGSDVPVGTNFILRSGSVDVVGPLYFPGLCWSPAASVCVDLAGETPGTLVSRPVNLPDGTYWLNFVLNGTGPTRPLRGDDMATARVTVASGSGTFFDQFFTYPSSYTGTVSVTVTVSGGQGTGTTLTFAAANPPHVSAATDPMSPATALMLDSVTLTDAGLPEPATFLGGAVVLPLIWMARRRRSKRQRSAPQVE